MSQSFRFLIVGGGFAGWAAALATSRAGATVELVEEATSLPTWPRHVNVPPNMLRDLQKLGVANECVRAGFPYHGVSFTDSRGREILRIPTERMAGMRLPSALGIAHSALVSLFAAAARAAGVTVRAGASVECIDNTGSSARVTFSDGVQQAYDLVIGADGFHSPLREQLFAGAFQPGSTEQAYWGVIVRRPATLDRLTMVMGLDGGKAGALPLSHEAACLTLLQREPHGELPLPEERNRVLQRLLATCRGVIADMRDQLRYALAPTVNVRRVVHGLLPDPWYRNRVIMVGDAAHTIPPRLGQSEAQDLEDAVVLGSLVEEGVAIDSLTARFMGRRFERCRITYETSLKLARWDVHPDANSDIRSAAASQARAVAQPV